MSTSFRTCLIASASFLVLLPASRLARADEDKPPDYQPVSLTEQQALTLLAGIPEIEDLKEYKKHAPELLVKARSLIKISYAPVKEEVFEFQTKLWEGVGLTPRDKKASQLSETDARAMFSVARYIRTRTSQPIPSRALISSPRAAIQMLQCEDEQARKLLIQTLAADKSDLSAEALASRALFDLSPELRKQAIEGLRGKPAAKYQDVLLAGFRHPWPPVADNAALALVALGDASVLPRLEKLLPEPDPQLPVVKPGQGKNPMVRELVRVNHLRNCMLCHAPSYDLKARVFGVVPEEGKQLPPPTVYYSRRAPSDLVVSPDITYIKQDFSVMLPVGNAAPWPDSQRYDFVVRMRTSTTAELEMLHQKPETYVQREAALYAIRQLQTREVIREGIQSLRVALRN